MVRLGSADPDGSGDVVTYLREIDSVTPESPRVYRKNPDGTLTQVESMTEDIMARMGRA